jgi:hypothetical protein
VYFYGEELPRFQQTSLSEELEILRGFLGQPERHSLTDPNKPTPKVGDPLTLQQFNDDEFMRRVRRVEWADQITKLTQADCKSSISSFKYHLIREAYNRNWTVTITEVVS